MIWLVVVGTISQSELCWVVLTNQLHTHVVGKISCGDTVMRCHSGRGQVKWPTGLVAGGKSNDWLFWWQGARQMTDWFGGRGQGKWLTGLVAGGKANDWLMWWHGDAVTLVQWCSDVVTWCHSGRGQVRWLTGLVAGGKANEWLVWWQGARQMTD